MTYIRQVIMILFAIVVLLALQYQYWFGTNGHRDLTLLNKQIAEQQYVNDEQQKANKVLLADVKDLKNGLEAVEEHARVDLGLIKSGETFVQMSTVIGEFDTQDHHLVDSPNFQNNQQPKPPKNDENAIKP
ncbi:septum formation initiator family protein [Moraxella macacae]|uniref:septum formation initiator family protein n=1 Tax=Moraxella macacae TaxID=765840 RepID=UPI0002E1F59F|nr:septum formation initiator family protein [Moraxella macacae]